jgi:hypothetical protein
MIPFRVNHDPLNRHHVGLRVFVTDDFGNAVDTHYGHSRTPQQDRQNTRDEMHRQARTAASGVRDSK